MNRRMAYVKQILWEIEIGQPHLLKTCTHNVNEQYPSGLRVTDRLGTQTHSNGLRFILEVEKKQLS